MFNKFFIALVTAGLAAAATFSNPKGSLSKSPTAKLTKVPGLTPKLTARGLQTRQITPEMVFCLESNCVACGAFPIGPFDECLIPTGFEPYPSFFVSDPSGVGLPIIGVGSDCNDLIEVPEANVCFNISPAGEVVAFF